MDGNRYRLTPIARRRLGPVSARAAWCVVAVIPLTFLGIFFAWPVVALVGRGFWADGGIDVSGFVDVFAEPRTRRLIGLTLAQAGAGTVLAVVLGLPVAYVLYRCSFPGRMAARVLVAVPFVLPTVVVGVAFRSLLVGPLAPLHLDESFAGIVLALVFFNLSVVVRTVGGLWERLDPRAEQAARTLGAGPGRTWWTVTLPALAPAIGSAAAVVFLFCATAFGVVLVLGGARYGTVETEIWVRTTQFLDLRGAAVLSVVQLVIVGMALVIANRARSGRERAVALVAAPMRTRRPGPVAAAVTTTVLALLIVTPMANLVVRSLRSDSGWTVEHYRNLATTGGRGALTVTVWQAAANSLRIAALAAALAVVIGGLVAFVVSRRPRARAGRRAVAVLDSVFMLPLGVSAVTVGFGFLITLDRPLGFDVDLRSMGLLVPIAQAVVAIPLVVRTVLPVLRSIDPGQREVAAAMGAAPVRVLATIDLPVAGRALGLAVGFAFAVSLGEFGATSFLARPQSATLPVVIFRLIGRPGADNYGMALAASVVLAGLTAMVMVLVERTRAGVAVGEF